MPTDGVEPPDCPDMFSADYYARTGWNLTKLPHCRGSVLRVLQTAVNGVNVPWLYIGMMFSSFCWHNEDNYLYSINYSHFGDVKQWYGVPSAQAKMFEKVQTRARVMYIQRKFSMMCFYVCINSVGVERFSARALPRVTRPAASHDDTNTTCSANV